MMADQVIIDFPELTDEEYKHLLHIREKIVVKVWKSDERKTYPLTWEGTRLCCPITFWYDFPEEITVHNSLLKENKE